MKLRRAATAVLALAPAALAAGYYCALVFRPGNSHAVRVLGVIVPGGQYGSSVLTFSWAFLIAMFGLLTVGTRLYTKLRGRAPS